MPDIASDDLPNVLDDASRPCTPIEVANHIRVRKNLAYSGSDGLVVTGCNPKSIDLETNRLESNFDLLFVVGANPKTLGQRMVSDRINVSANERPLEGQTSFEDFGYAISKIRPKVGHISRVLFENGI